MKSDLQTIIKQTDQLLRRISNSELSHEYKRIAASNCVDIKCAIRNHVVSEWRRENPGTEIPFHLFE